MKNTLSILGAIFLASFALSTCGDKSTNSNKGQGKEEQKKAIQISNDSVKADLEKKSLQDSISITEFLKTYYSSLELSASQNQKQFEEGGVKFNVNKFKSCIDNTSKYSKLRFSNLTGNYHERYNIRLLSIDSISGNGNLGFAYTTVEYVINEIGKFQNLEKVIINMNSNGLTLNKWEDIKVKKKEVVEQEGLENFSEKDFYKIMGSVNK